MLEKFKKELIEAMKNKDKVKLNTLRSVKGAMQLERINNKKEENDELLVEVVNKQIKLRNDSVEEFKKAGREDLVKSYMEEIEILNEYMPKQLTEEEINNIIEESIKESNATTIKDLGNVMRIATPKLKNKCDILGEFERIKRWVASS